MIMSLKIYSDTFYDWFLQLTFRGRCNKSPHHVKTKNYQHLYIQNILRGREKKCRYKFNSVLHPEH